MGGLVMDTIEPLLDVERAGEWAWFCAGCGVCVVCIGKGWEKVAGCTLGDSASPGEGAVMFITRASRAVCVCVGGGGGEYSK